jgi:hypothetical protein
MAGSGDCGLHLERRSAFHESIALHLCCSGDGGRGWAQHETTLADFDLGVRVGDLEVRQNGADGPRQIARLRVFTADLVLQPIPRKVEFLFEPRQSVGHQRVEIEA